MANLPFIFLMTLKNALVHLASLPTILPNYIPKGIKR